MIILVATIQLWPSSNMCARNKRQQNSMNIDELLQLNNQTQTQLLTQKQDKMKWTTKKNGEKVLDLRAKKD